jgi:hypothetical protein
LNVVGNRRVSRVQEVENENENENENEDEDEDDLGSTLYRAKHVRGSAANIVNICCWVIEAREATRRRGH